MKKILTAELTLFSDMSYMSLDLRQLEQIIEREIERALPDVVERVEVSMKEWTV